MPRPFTFTPIAHPSCSFEFGEHNAFVSPSSYALDYLRRTSSKMSIATFADSSATAMSRSGTVSPDGNYDSVGLGLDRVDSIIEQASSKSSQPYTDRIQTLLNHASDITPVSQPVLPLPRTANISPFGYLPFYARPYSQRVAQWQHDLFDIRHAPPNFRSESEIGCLRPDGLTMIALLYPDETPGEARRPLSTYLERLSLLARYKQQMIVYTPPYLAPHIRALRSDPHWLVIDDYETPWHVPNNRHQMCNFTSDQITMYTGFRGPRVQTCYTTEPDQGYNKSWLFAVYNAKAFLTYDAVMRNPFGSRRFMYVDAGFLTERMPWAEFDDFFANPIDDSKIDRAIKISRSSGVVMGEYARFGSFATHDYKRIDHEAWTDPGLAWHLRPFLAHCWVGDALGMLNFSVRYMQTVDDLDANGYPTGREEYVLPHVAVRYPNTIFSIPDEPFEGMPECPPQQVIKLCYSGLGGAKGVPAIDDPLSTLFCPGYKPRHRNLKVGELCDCEICEAPIT